MSTKARWHRRLDGADDGFTMIEMIMAMLIISIVMAAFATFFVTTVSATARQSSAQVATQLADDAIERARALPGQAITANRDKTSSDAQWGSPVSGVATYLTDMQEAYSVSAGAGAGASATLPTTNRQVTVNGIVYNQNWYIGICWQPTGGGACAAAPGNTTGACGTAPSPGAACYYRVIVAITWNDKRCAASTCSYVSATLISAASSEPLFLANGTAPAPSVTNPGSQTSEVTVADTLQMVATTGAPSITWAATGLPPGLTIAATTGLISGTPTASGSYTATVTATDGFSLVGSTSFSWTVNAVPALSSPGNQFEELTQSDTINPSLSGGTPAYTWTITGLPAGLTYDTTSGIITGTPTATGSFSITQKVVDSYGLSSTTTFNIAVNAALLVTNPGSQVGDVSTAISGLQLANTGGFNPDTWTLTSGLPAGLAFSTGGKFTGTPTTAGTNTVVVKATDAQGFTSSVTFTWTIAAAPKITSPTAATASVAHNTAYSLTPSATGGSGTLTWNVTGLPSTLTFSTTTGKITGTPTTVNSTGYTVVIKVTDSLGVSASFTYTLKVS